MFMTNVNLNGIYFHLRQEESVLNAQSESFLHVVIFFP